jgi:prolyl 4-hydroxylase
VRTNAAAQFGLERMDVVLAVVRERIARAAGLPVPGLEWTQVLHYAVGQAFDWHVDWLDPATPGYAADLAARGQRIATCLVFLNDDFEGGETAFEAGGLRHRGRKGDALMWANTLPDGSIDPRTRHAGLPPTRVTAAGTSLPDRITSPSSVASSIAGASSRSPPLAFVTLYVM